MSATTVKRFRERVRALTDRTSGKSLKQVMVQLTNVVVHANLNCLTTIRFAVDVLKVKHIIVCVHYGCGGVLAALRGDRVGLADNWLRHVEDVRNKHRVEVEGLSDLEAQHRRLCELNVIEQALNVSQTTVVREAWARGHHLAVHSWIYGLENGLLKDLEFSASSEAESVDFYVRAISRRDTLARG